MTRRHGIGAVAAAALAAAAGVLIALPATGTGHGGPGGRPHTAAGPGTPATAAAMLLLAAHAAAATPNLTPRPGQFVYTEQLIEGDLHGGHVPRHPYRQGAAVSVADVAVRRRQARARGYQRSVTEGTWSRLGGAESLCEAVQDHPGQQVCDPRLPDGAAPYRL